MDDGEIGAGMKIKKKKIKWYLVGAVALFACLSVFLFVSLGKNSQGAKMYNKQIQAESNAMTEELLAKVDLVTQSTTKQQEAHKQPEQTEQKPQDQAIQQGESQGAKGRKDEVGKKEKEKQKAYLAETLQTEYYAILLEQKSQAVAMVDQLVAQGRADYETLKASGQWNATAKATLLSDYMARVDGMETQMDRSFSSLVSRMEDNLIHAGVEAKPIIDYFQSEYKKIKEENRSAFLDKVFS